MRGKPHLRRRGGGSLAFGPRRRAHRSLLSKPPRHTLRPLPVRSTISNTRPAPSKINMLSDEQRKYVERLFEASSWHGQSTYAQRPIRHFGLGSIYFHSWRHHRIWRTPSTPPATGMILRAGDKPDGITAVVSIILWECNGITAAHD